RDAELAQLHELLEKALRGERQVVFVTGEPGIGKTTLVEAFVDQMMAQGQLVCARGQCLEHYGAGEAYLPVLEALSRLCRAQGGEVYTALLHQYAPTWLVQMPWLLTASEREALQRQLFGMTRERMLREMAEALRVLTIRTPLILVLEDLHWSDYSTLDLLTSLARRQEAPRLLVIGTYRPVDVIISEHPLKAIKQELQMHGQCTEVALNSLSEEAVSEYLTLRLAARATSRSSLRGLAHTLRRRTDGNPLFLTTVVDDLTARGILVQQQEHWKLKAGIAEEELGVPEGVRQMIERQVERLSPEEQQVLEVASVVGVKFSTAAAAAALEREEAWLEECCEQLARRGQFVYARGLEEWPDGTLTMQYEFLHTLYQSVVYERIGVARRMRLHQRIGEREEQGYGERAGERAAELARHFEQGRDYRRAVRYRRQAGDKAVQRCAIQEALDHLTRGLTFLQSLPESRERAQEELFLQAALGPVLMAVKGYAAPEVEQVYARARELCRQVGETPQLFPVLWGLFAFEAVRANFHHARELAERLLQLAQRLQDPALLLMSHEALAQITYLQGEPARAQEHAAQGCRLYDLQAHRSLAFLYGEDPGVVCVGVESWIVACLGYHDQALKSVHNALSLAREVDHPLSLAQAFLIAAKLHQHRREVDAVHQWTEEAITLASKEELPFFLAVGTILRGWVLSEQGRSEEGIAQMRQGMAAYRATGAESEQTHHLALLAHAYGKAGQIQEGLDVVDEALALVQRNGERYCEAELYRLKGELTLQKAG
ncbi:MAG: AAA family ATPase, partial [Deltaproteobacteria bacterium]|nr:AAA family ATPase [Deltaproteobacteria bacterium]